MLSFYGKKGKQLFTEKIKLVESSLIAAGFSSKKKNFQKQ